MIRKAIATDLRAIVQIYNASIPSRMATGDLEPITPESRLDWFYAHTPHSYPIWVMENGDQVVGWLSFQAFYVRCAYKHTVELSLYISPAYQRQGIGKKLLEKAIAESPSLGVKTIVCYVFAHNQASLNLFKQYSFVQWGYLPKVAILDGVERDLVILGRKC